MRRWIELSDPERERSETRSQPSLHQATDVERRSSVHRIMELVERRFLPEKDPKKLTQEQLENELRKLSGVFFLGPRLGRSKSEMFRFPPVQKRSEPH